MLDCTLVAVFEVDVQCTFTMMYTLMQAVMYNVCSLWCVVCLRSVRVLRQVTEACDAIENEHMRHLLLLRESPRYAERQEAVLQQMLDHTGKMHRCAALSRRL